METKERLEIFQDTSRSIDERAQAIVDEMTVEEAAGQLRYDSLPIDRLGIPRYNWWNEALHGVARAGVATVFPQAIGLAAIFDDDYLKKIAEIIATEARAKYNSFSSKGDRDIYKGLTYWTPNINIFRDPRWGRGQETYGEDPYLTTKLGIAFIEGLQGTGKHMKIAACAKHFAVHSGPEEGRHSFNAIASKKDMEETYLPAFEAAVKEAKVESVMGAYNRTNGEPCCGSKALMVDLLRGKWDFDGYFVSDCWAIRDFHEHHKVTKNVYESAALALKMGCDINCGNTYLYMMSAYEQGLVTEEDIKTAAYHAMRTRLKLGCFEETEYDSIPYSVNDCREHRMESLNAARKSMVLLKNENDNFLPLDRSKFKNIAVIGPNANSELMLSGNYYGTASQYVTILDGVHEIAGEDITVRYSDGCHLYLEKTETLAGGRDRLMEAVAVAEESDLVILALGLDSGIEGEEGDAGNSYAAGDKIDLKLPGLQMELMERIVATGKPVILALGAGSAMDLTYADEHCKAVIQMWYPGSYGGRALCDLIFGKASPSGKLPVTFYKDTEGMLDFTDYSMKGRTYRYLEREPLYPFGYGLTYGDVEVTKAQLAGEKENLKVTIEVANQGDVDVEEVVQVYVKNTTNPLAVKNHSLRAFKRVALKAGETQSLELTIDKKSFEVINEDGEHLFEYRDKFKIFVGTNGPDSRSIQLTGKKPIELEL